MLQWFLLAVNLLLATPAAVATPSRSAGIAVTPDGGRVIVTNADSASVSIVDATTRQLVAEIATGGAPQTVVIAPNGRDMYVATRDMVRIVDLAERRVTGSLSAGADAFGVVTDAERLYVSATASSQVRVFDLATLREVARIKTEAAPRGLAIDPEHRRLFVTHFRTGRVSIIDTVSLAVAKVISTGAEHNLSQGVVLDATNRRLYLPVTRSNSSNQALLFDTTVFPIVAVLNTETEENVVSERMFIDITDRPVNMPFDAVITPGRRMFVVNSGSDDVSAIDLAARRGVGHIAVGSNPRSIALSPDGATAYVNNTLSGTVSFIDTTTNAVIATVKTTTLPLPPDILLGKILFHTSARPSLSKDRWISCATCHFDGGADGRTWFFRDGPRNTPPLFGVGSTLPMHWSGDLDELQDVELTVRVTQAGTGLVSGDSGCDPACNLGRPNAGRSSDLDALSAFMRVVQAPPSEIDASAPAVVRGSAVFFDSRVGCAACHMPPLYTDRQRHDVGTGSGALERKGSSFDTPSLRGVFDTAPYFHDGSALTLADVVKNHGNTKGLTQQELDDLVEFLRSIPFPSERRRAVRR